ncbi:putative bifunctional diguanylate cyclase/phosphodiesterase [Marinobacter sp.]|uniref:putative bifunctional diguanylate cyclase/phosphodiesterase n=1 Tax=Marinobacter sp. TaxID=50741 RepID=UPI0035C6C417
MAITDVFATNTEQRQQTASRLLHEYRHAFRVATLAILLIFGNYLVYRTGGTAYAYPYLMLVPVLLAAAWYRIVGGLVTATVAGILMALMPLDVERGIDQETANWLLRLGLYIGLGAFAGGLFHSIFKLNRNRERLMFIDHPSGLPNSLALRKDLSGRLRHQGAKQGVALILIRIIDIPDVLEALGIDASDELISAVGRRIRAETPPSAQLYRFSNSELMLLLSGAHSLQTERIVRNLVDIGEDNVIVQDMPMRAQTVYGSCLAGPEACEEGLIRRARLAMFAALEKNVSHEPYSPQLERKPLETIQLIARVRDGLDRQEFELHYQPKIRLSDNSVCGAEGLIRWRDGKGGFIPPGKYMAKVESTTLISPVTRFVMDEASRFAWSSPGTVSINFSGRNLLDNQLLSRLETLLRESGLPPERLEIEITESVLMQDLDAARESINRIRALGVGVSIDDFGTGFASFEYLRHLPVTGLKIDRVFVKELELDEKAQKLMTCMVEVGHALGLEVTAEGVETTGQCDILRATGCDLAQGFLFSPALPGDAFSHWLEQRKAL